MTAKEIIKKIKIEVSSRLESAETEYEKSRDPYYDGKATALGSFAMWLIHELESEVDDDSE